MKPILCVIDIQKEYNTAGRPFYIHGVVDSINQAHKTLQHARRLGWDIIHVKHIQSGQIFSAENEYSNFIEGFEPLNGESICLKDNFSCFSSTHFTKLLENKTGSEIFVIGYGSTMCCLSTIIDGYHRGYKFTFISDASNAKPSGALSSETLHNSSTEILKTFCKVKTFEEL